MKRLFRAMEFAMMTGIALVSLVLYTVIAYSFFHAVALLAHLLFRGGRS